MKELLVSWGAPSTCPVNYDQETQEAEKKSRSFYESRVYRGGLTTDENLKVKCVRMRLVTGTSVQEHVVHPVCRMCALGDSLLTTPEGDLINQYDFYKMSDMKVRLPAKKI